MRYLALHALVSLSISLCLLQVSAQVINAENNIVIAAGNSEFPWVLTPQVAATTDAGYVISWAMYNPEATQYEYVIGAQKFNAGGNQTGSPVQLNITSPNFALLTTAALGEGGFVITFLDDLNIIGTFFNSEGGWNGEQILATLSGNPKGQYFALASIGSGGVVASWINNEELNIQSFDALSNPITNVYQIGLESNYGVVMSTGFMSGNAVIIVGVPSGLFGQAISSNGELSGIPTPFSSPLLPFQYITNVSNNEVALGYTQTNSCGLYVQVYNSESGQIQKNGECINNDTGINAATLGFNGEAYQAIWTVGNNEEVGWSAIYGRTYNKNGEQESPLVLVNNSVNLQNYFTVSSATLSSGFSVVTWTSGFRVQNSTVIVQWLNSTGFPVPPTPPQPNPPNPNSGYIINTISSFVIVLACIIMQQQSLNIIFQRVQHDQFV